MNIAEWILVIFLSTALLVFLILGVVLLAKLIGVTKEVKKIVLKGQDIATNANDVVNNVKGMTSIGGIVKNFAEKYKNESKEKRDGKKSNN